MLCVFRHRGGESRDRGGGADPVKLRPGHGHAAVVVRVVAGAAESLLGQEDQVLLGQAPVALHLGLVLHVDGVAQLRPQHLVRHEERHPSLSGAAETAEELHPICWCSAGQRRRGMDGKTSMYDHTAVFLYCISAQRVKVIIYNLFQQ